MAPGVTLAKGYLLKHNRDHRSNILPGAKYKRRWVEVTADTMVYAPSQQDALTGQIQVFAIADMVWVKPAADTKFLVKFPERTLKFKVAAGGQEEREQWVAALQNARKMNEAARQARNSGAGKLEQLQKALLPHGPDPIANTSASSGLAQASESGSMVLSSAGTTLDGSTLAGGNSRSSTLPGLNFTGSSFGIIDDPDSMSGGPRQLSPRSLLASARAGMALVNSASLSGTPRARTPPTAAAGSALAAPSLKPKPAQERFFANHATDSDVEEDSESEAGSSEADEQGQKQQAEQEEAVPAAAADAGPSMSPAQAAAAAGTAEVHAGQRPPLARRVTPGVLLASPRPTSASTPAAAAAAAATAAAHGHSSPLSPLSPHPSTLTASPMAPSAADRPGSAKPAAVFSRALSGADEILVLDDSEPNSPVGQKQQQQHQQQHQLQAHSTLSPAYIEEQQQQQQQASSPASTPGRTSTSSTSGMRPSEVYSTTLYSTHTMPSRPASGNRSRWAGAAPAPPAAAVAAAASDAGDEVLRLDEDEVLTTPVRPLSAATILQQQQQQYSALMGQRASAEAIGGSNLQQPVASGVRPGMLQVGSRPGSAGSRPGSAYRPGTPLKSCLRNSPAGSGNFAQYTP